MRRILFVILLGLTLLPNIAWAEKRINVKPKTPQEWREYIRFRRDETLEALYKLKPAAREDIARAKGYAVFVNFNMNVVFFSASTGRGVLHENNFGGKETFMRMAQAGVGLGLGVKDFRAVFVFDDRSVMDKFLNNGWQFGTEADAAVKGGGTGAAASGAIGIAPGLRVYQLTENGLNLQATLNGTKYWVDKEVNLK